MTRQRTWIWIVGGAAAAGLIVVIAVAAAGVYFVSSHVEAGSTTGVEAAEAFDRVAADFANRRALYEVDDQDRPHLTVALPALPSSPSSASVLMVQAWDPERERLVRLSLPFWLLRLGPEQFRVSRRTRGFDVHQLDLDIDELERIGPALVLDYRDQDGVRVLLWTH